jgi:hypothetical protein
MAKNDAIEAVVVDELGQHFETKAVNVETCGTSDVVGWTSNAQDMG